MPVQSKSTFIKKFKLTDVDKLVLLWFRNLLFCYLLIELALYVHSGLLGLVALVGVSLSTFVFIDKLFKLKRS